MRVSQVFAGSVAGVAVIGGLVAATAASSSGDAVDPAQQKVVSGLLHEAMPASSATLTRRQDGGLQIRITADDAAFGLPNPSPAEAMQTDEKRTADDIQAAEVGWRSQLVAGLAALRNDEITDFVVSPSGFTPTASQANYLSAYIRPQAGQRVGGSLYHRIGAVTADAAVAQMQSNLAALTQALPTGTVEATQVDVVPVDPAANVFGIDAMIRVTSIDELSAHLGDVVDGLATGLAGNTDAVAAGVAINVVDDRGQRAGWWRADQAGIGMGIPGPLADAEQTPPDINFPNFTGGPGTAVAVSGGAGTARPNARAHHGPVVAPGRGIGPVVIGERKARVEQVLGDGRRQRNGSRTYQSNGARLNVIYSRGRVSRVWTPSSRSTVRGTQVSRGYKVLRQRLPGWTGAKCYPLQVLTRIASHGHRVTSLQWRRSQFIKAEVDAHGPGSNCGVP